MSIDSDDIANLQKLLVRRLNQFGGDFKFSKFVREAGIDPEEARSVAELFFTRFFMQVAEDGDITRRERRKLHKLADRLKISDDSRDDIEEKVSNGVYRTALREAKADGVITDEERETLQSLKTELGLAGFVKSQQDSSDDKHRPSVIERLNRLKKSIDRLTKKRPVLTIAFTFGFMVFMLFSCAIWDARQDSRRKQREQEFRGRMASIKLGMSEDEVIAIVGPPTSSKESKRNWGEWTLHQVQGLKTRVDVPVELRGERLTRQLRWKVGKLKLTVEFVDGRVVGSRVNYSLPHFRRR